MSARWAPASRDRQARRFPVDDPVEQAGLAPPEPALAPIASTVADESRRRSRLRRRKWRFHNPRLRTPRQRLFLQARFGATGDFPAGDPAGRPRPRGRKRARDPALLRPAAFEAPALLVKGAAGMRSAFSRGSPVRHAAIAQLVEHLIRNEGVGVRIPLAAPFLNRSTNRGPFLDPGLIGGWKLDFRPKPGFCRRDHDAVDDRAEPGLACRNLSGGELFAEILGQGASISAGLTSKRAALLSRARSLARTARSRSRPVWKAAPSGSALRLKRPASTRL